MYLDTLPGIARGYKLSGRKLTPRDSYDSARMKWTKCRNMRQLRKEDAIERDAMGYPGTRRVSKRIEKRAEAAYYDHTIVRIPKAARRILNQFYAEAARHAERNWG